jgi:FMN-binding domain
MRTSGLTWLVSGAALFMLADPEPAYGQALLSQEEALELAFPHADAFERETAFLSPEQVGLLEEATGASLERSVVTYYRALRGGEAEGVAYFDAHRVRTLNEVLMIAVGTDGGVVRVEVVSFAEPPEYKAPEGWRQLFEGRSWADDLSAKGDLPNITGATLTSRAVKRAVERVLALHRVIAPLGSTDR